MRKIFRVIKNQQGAHKHILQVWLKKVHCLILYNNLFINHHLLTIININAITGCKDHTCMSRWDWKFNTVLTRSISVKICVNMKAEEKKSTHWIHILLESYYIYLLTLGLCKTYMSLYHPHLLTNGSSVVNGCHQNESKLLIKTLQ